MSEGNGTQDPREGVSGDRVARLSRSAGGAGWAPPGGAAAAPAPSAQVTFDRLELRELFNLYGRKVAEGEWRDYAIDFLPDRAVFSVFRRAHECALYRIEKTPRLARRQGAYAVIATSGMVLKRGADLVRVLRMLEKPRLVIR